MPSGLQHRAVLRNPAVLINTASVSRNLRNDVLDRNITLRYNQTAKDANISEERGIKMFNKSIIKKAAAIAAVILAVTAFPFNIAKADTQTSGSTVPAMNLIPLTDELFKKPDHTALEHPCP